MACSQSSHALALLPVLLVASGCVSAAGPARVELATVLKTSPADLIGVRCHGFDEEPTEVVCRYRKRDAAGAWADQVVFLAIDSAGWMVIDGPASPSR